MGKLFYLKIEGPTYELHLGLKTEMTATLKFNVSHIASSKGVSKLSLDSTTSNALPGRDSDEAFNECLGTSNISLPIALV